MVVLRYASTGAQEQKRRKHWQWLSRIDESGDDNSGGRDTETDTDCISVDKRDVIAILYLRARRLQMVMTKLVGTVISS
jgi:hypothetical protein